jgi:hypothetical protein
MQSTLATLLLVTSAVVLTCVVVEFAVVSMEQTLQTSNMPQMDRIRTLESMMLNQTENLFNQAMANQTMTNETVTLPQTTFLP